MFECVVNLSEGRRADVVTELALAGGPCVVDVHADAGHHRSVLTLAGPLDQLEPCVRRLAAAAVARLDLSGHAGAHPRFGVLDVVPWVPFAGWPLRPAPLGPAVGARDRFAAWAGAALGLPCFLYGPERSLPMLRRLAWHPLRPETGPRAPHPTAGSCAVGARAELVAYNLWLDGDDLSTARRIAAGLRGSSVRALGLRVGDGIQVSCNLIEPSIVGPAAVFDAVAAQTAVARAELVGLLPARLLEDVPRRRWQELDVDEARTIEARLQAVGRPSPEH
jgi:glutamate formiminotransferase